MGASSKKVIYAALAGNTLIAITKFAAALLTGSSAMLSEGIHSLVDTGNQVLLLYGLKRAERPADSHFPFGHGKEVYFWSFVVAILIFAVGAGVSTYEGVHHIIHPQPSGNPGINYLVLGMAALFEGGALYFAVREFRKTKGKDGFIKAVQKSKDPTLFVVLFEDSAAMLGLFTAFAGVMLTQLTGNPFFDGAASVVIGIILGCTAIWLAYETKGLLIGESAATEVVAGIRTIAERFDKVEHINEVLTTHFGPDFILVNLSIDFSDNATAGEIEEIISLMDREIKAAYPTVKRVFVEAEAWARKPRQADH